MRYKKENTLLERMPVALLLTAICAGIVFVGGNAFAEGNHPGDHAQGVNRPIYTTPNGYVEVTGTGTMSISDLPPNGGDFYDEPTFYLGGHVGKETVDAGMQYYPVELYGYAAGWGAFISWNGQDHDYTNPSVLRDSDGQPVKWRATDGPKSMTTTLTFNFKKTKSGDVVASLYVDALHKRQSTVTIKKNSGTFFYSEPGNPGTVANADHPIAPWYGQHLTTVSLSGANVKRVVGMTRSGGGSSNDGSKLVSTWSNCQVKLLGGNLTNWVSSIVDQDRTGYDAPGNGSPDAKDGMHEYKVDFPSLTVSSTDARTNSTTSKQAKQGDASRYTTETVIINLRQPGTRGKGKEITID